MEKVSVQFLCIFNLYSSIIMYTHTNLYVIGLATKMTAERSILFHEYLHNNNQTNSFYIGFQLSNHIGLGNQDVIGWPHIIEYVTGRQRILEDAIGWPHIIEYVAGRQCIRCVVDLRRL